MYVEKIEQLQSEVMQLRTPLSSNGEDDLRENAEESEPRNDTGFDDVKLKLSLLEEENAKLKKLVERSLDESIRVCVVAPTVNVHFNDQNLKLHSR